MASPLSCFSLESSAVFENGYVLLPQQEPWDIFSGLHFKKLKELKSQTSSKVGLQSF